MESLISDLPQDIQLEIFSKLPAKSAGKCRCLSKYWRTRLSTPEFINLHLKIHQKNNNIIFVKKHDSLNIIISPFDNARLLQMLPNTKWEGVCGSCNGLVLLESTKHDLFLVNPITLQQVQIPDTKYSKKLNTYKMYGFGYDPCTDDYKIVILFWKTLDHIACLDVYSLRKGSWKRVNVDNSFSLRPPFHGYRSMAFFNGALHWLTGKGHTLITAFDLETEVLREIPLSIYLSNTWYSGLFVAGGFLCMSEERSKHTTTDVWVMKEYGVVDSWIRYHINNSNLYVMPWCFTDKFLCICGNHWAVYNVKEKTTKSLVVDRHSNYIDNADVFVGSLVSLDHYVVSS